MRPSAPAHTHPGALLEGPAAPALGQDGEAAECHGAAIEINPGGSVAAREHADRGEIARVAGRLDKALAGCSAAIAINPGLAVAHASNASRPLQPGGAARGGAPMPRLRRFAAAGVPGRRAPPRRHAGACKCAGPSRSRRPRRPRRGAGRPRPADDRGGQTPVAAARPPPDGLSGASGTA